MNAVVAVPEGRAGGRGRRPRAKVVTVARWTPYVPRDSAELARVREKLVTYRTDMPVVGAAVPTLVTLWEILLVRTWGDRVDPAQVRGWRVVGLCVYSVDGVFHEGLLARSVDRKRYRMMLNSEGFDLPVATVDAWLFTIRGGHHGGPGRCQGVRAADCTYPRPVSLKLPPEMAAYFSRKGHGSFSPGLRAAAREAVADRIALPELRSTRNGGPTIRVKAYLDEPAIQTLLAFGQGNLTLGIKRLHLALTQPTHPA